VGRSPAAAVPFLLSSCALKLTQNTWTRDGSRAFLLSSESSTEISCYLFWYSKAPSKSLLIPQRSLGLKLRSLQTSVSICRLRHIQLAITRRYAFKQEMCSWKLYKWIVVLTGGLIESILSSVIRFRRFRSSYGVVE
jgi:hypothetical protein